MKRLLAVLLLSSPAIALEQPVEALVSAFGGESEAAVCERANREVLVSAAKALTQLLSDEKRYHQLLDDYRFHGKDRAALDTDMQAVVSDHLQFVPMEQFWSGRSCLVRGHADVSTDKVFAQLGAGMPERPAASGLSGWLDAVPGMTAMQNAAPLSAAMAELTMMKVYVSEYYIQHGRWPDSLTAMGIDPAEFRRSRYIEQVSLDDGAVRAVLRGDLAGEWILLSPSMGPLGSINWDCRVSVSTLFGPCEGP